MHLKDTFDVGLDQELEKKKKGKSAEPKLTKKQQEDIDAELQRESEIRGRINQVSLVTLCPCITLSLHLLSKSVTLCPCITLSVSTCFVSLSLYAHASPSQSPLAL